MAGLTALDRLSHAGFHVTVCEARGRAGGRVRTVREPFADNLYVDVGAAYVVDCHAHVLEYVDRLDLPLQIVNPRHLPAVVHLRGRNYPLQLTKPIDFPLRLTGKERQLGYLGLVESYLSSGLNAIGDPTGAGWPRPSAAAFDRMSGLEMLKRAGASPGAIELIGDGMLNVYGDGIASTSALFLLAEQKLANFTVAYTIPGGMERLPAALSALYRDRIRYGCQVTRIERRPDDIRVLVRGYGKTETAVEGDFCVVAVPYSALRRIRISPALSHAKQRVVSDLLNTSVVRVFVQCRDRFWERADPLGSASTDLPGLSIHPGYLRPGRRGILEGYFAGPEARRLSALPAAARDRRALREMSRVFPALPDHAEAIVTQCWDLDPWARGAYAWYRPGQLTAFLPHLAQPDGRLHFAGDHTSLIPGWMEGAIESGIRAAQEIELRT